MLEREREREILTPQQCSMETITAQASAGRKLEISALEGIITNGMVWECFKNLGKTMFRSPY
jgi:hypothetical protein